MYLCGRNSLAAATFNVSYLIKSHAGSIMTSFMMSLLALAPPKETKGSLNLEAPLFQVTICPGFIISNANRIMGGGQNPSLP
jgi:hypothetical protein